MDKSGVNDQIVWMRKGVKESRRRVSQQLLKSCKLLEQRLEKARRVGHEESAKKLETKVINKKREKEMVKSICCDQVSKRALLEKGSFKKTIENSNATLEERLIAKLANESVVQKDVAVFRERNPNWDQWLDSLLQLWQEKRDLRNDRSKAVMTGANCEIVTVSQAMTGTEKVITLRPKADGYQKQMPTPDEAEKAIVAAPPKSMVVCQLRVERDKEGVSIGEVVGTEGEARSESESETEAKKPNEETSTPRMVHKDAFFLTEDGHEIEEEPQIEEVKSTFKQETHRLTFQSRDTRKSHFETNDRKMSHWQESRKERPVERIQKVENKPGFGQNPAEEDEICGRESKSKAPGLHPSWEAKRKLKESLATAFRVKGKHLKFDS